MKVSTLPERPATALIVAVIDFDPWPFSEEAINVDPTIVGTISSDASVTWAQHRAFNMLNKHLWARLVVFEDGRSAVAHRDHKFIDVGTILAVRS